jgi:hypothetical protein
VFWQPVFGGEQVVRQWLRMRVGAAMFDGSGKVSTTDLATRLEGGEVLEIGGYFLTPSLTRELRALDLSELLGPSLGCLHVFEIGEGPDVSAAVQRLAKDHDVGVVERLPGEPFWSATEIVLNPDLVERTVRCLTESMG